MTPDYQFAETPVFFVKPLEHDYTALEGDTVTLDAEVSKPDLEGIWYKDEIEILPDVDEKFEITAEGNVHELTVHQVALEDEGEYTVQVGPVSSTSTLLVDGGLNCLA